MKHGIDEDWGMVLEETTEQAALLLSRMGQFPTAWEAIGFAASVVGKALQDKHVAGRDKFVLTAAMCLVVVREHDGMPPAEQAALEEGLQEMMRKAWSEEAQRN